MKSLLTAKRFRTALLVPGLLVAVFLALTACRAKPADRATVAQLQQEVQKLRTDNQELKRLQAENQDLPRLRRDNDELRRLREATNDLARLRAENDQLRGQLQALKAPTPAP
jgi:septal ring factor EnvC (AmiA/AmiB activator)